MSQTQHILGFKDLKLQTFLRLRFRRRSSLPLTCHIFFIAFFTHLWLGFGWKGKVKEASNRRSCGAVFALEIMRKYLESFWTFSSKYVSLKDVDCRCGWLRLICPMFMYLQYLKFCGHLLCCGKMKFYILWIVKHSVFFSSFPNVFPDPKNTFSTEIYSIFAPYATDSNYMICSSTCQTWAWMN